ncbi:MAG: peptidoglycan-binding lysin domain protein, partial [Planctomycetota bacterium]
MMRATNPNPTGNPMSLPTPNSNPNLAAQAAAQAAQAAIQAAKAKAQNALAADAEAEEPSAAENDEQLAKAWGFAGKRPRISKEAVIGLMAICALLGLFGYVVMQHFRNRDTVAEKKVDPDVQPASNSNQIGDSNNVMTSELDEFENNVTKTKPKRNLLDDEDFNIGEGQSDPDAGKVVTRKPSLPVNMDDEFGDFDEGTKTSNFRNQPKASAAANDTPNFDDNDPPARSNRAAATLDLGIEEQTEPEQPALTKTTGPIQLRQPVQPTEPAEEEFEEPVHVTAKPRPEPQDDFEPVPQRSRTSTRVTQKDMFADTTGFDDPKTKVPPTTDLPPARQEPTVKKSSKHPLLRDGEYLVEEGDNFCVISKKLYGSEKYYLALAEHNRSRVADPCRMRPGLIIAAPPKTVLEQQHSALIPKPKAAVEAKEEKPHATKKVSAALPSGMYFDEQGAPWYRVGKGDTLSEIAQAHLGRASRAIHIANRNQ